MDNSDLTIIMVAYRPKINLLKSLILKFNNLYKILITNNSEKKLDESIYELKNTDVIENEKNLGNGAGINVCLRHCKTKFALYLDIDANITIKELHKLTRYSEKIKKFGVLVPNGQHKISQEKISKKWDIEGSIMLINKNYINNEVVFDEKYFLYYEETDFFFNCLKKGKNVYFLPKVEFSHERATSIDEKDLHDKEKIKLLRQWHYMWSMFYFYKKNFSFFIAVSKTFHIFLKDLFFLMINLVTFDKQKIRIRYYRINGLMHSFLGMKSNKRL